MRKAGPQQMLASLVAMPGHSSGTVSSISHSSPHPKQLFEVVERAFPSEGYWEACFFDSN